jgi:hypothetical protein
MKNPASGSLYYCCAEPARATARGEIRQGFRVILFNKHINVRQQEEMITSISLPDTVHMLLYQRAPWRFIGVIEAQLLTPFLS